MKAVPRLTGVRVAASLAVASGALGVMSLLATSAAPAAADPGSTTAFVGLGADVTQDLFDAYNGASPTPGDPGGTGQPVNFYIPLHSSDGTSDFTIQSFDADPPGGTTLVPGCITTKTGGPSFDRPNSTTNGITALSDSLNNTPFNDTGSGVTSCTGATHAVNPVGQIDFARAARGPNSSGSNLTFVAYARDALGFLYFDHSTGLAASLTSAELSSLYSSPTGQITLPDGFKIDAGITISGSTPRSNLETALGVTDAQVATAANAVGLNSITQNSGNAFYSKVSSLPAGTGAVIPISSASWISQANQVGADRSATARANGVDLASIDSLGKPYTGTAPSETPNTPYYQSTTYGYNVNTVLPTDVLIGGSNVNVPLDNLFVGASAAICSTANQATAHTFGFDSLTGSEGTCGVTELTGNS